VNADLTIVRARLPGRAGTVDVVIRAGIIDAVIPSDAGGKRNGASDRLDAGGRWLIPGLWDEHVHFSQWAMTSRRLDLVDTASAAETIRIVGTAIDGGADEVVGFGFRDGLWPDLPDRAALDGVSGEVPVVLVSADLHSCWLNSAALRRHGFAGHTESLLREDDAFRVENALDVIDDATLDLWVDESARAAAARGVVGILDLEMRWNRDDWLRRVSAGTDVLRVEFGIYTRHLDEAIGEGMRSGDPVESTGLIRVGPYKVISDGSLNTRTAWCVDPYPGLDGNDAGFGQATVAYDELVPLLKLATDSGLTPAVHAIGDRANQRALDAFAAIGRGGRIEHAQLVTWADVPRFAELGVTASMQPEHAMDDRDVADRYWAGRTERSFALASLARAGVNLALGSDAPVAPLDPWVTMAAAVGRARDGREPWHPEQAIDVAAALAASTRGRASVATGAPADLVLVERDPLRASVDELRTMPVAATLLEGRLTYDAR
jgi:predicted amidohydrolase YtcJ